MLFSLASRRGEQPVVLSFRSSRRLALWLVTTGRYSSTSCTHLRTLSTNAPHANGFCMCLQPFSFRQRHDCRRNLIEATPGKLLDGDGLHKILYSKSSTKAGRAAGWQNVVRASGVVSCGLGRIVADENRNVLWGYAVGPLESLFAGTSNQRCSILLEGFCRYGVVCGP